VMLWAVSLGSVAIAWWLGTLVFWLYPTRYLAKWLESLVAQVFFGYKANSNDMLP
jgi:hypothetical protein